MIYHYTDIGAFDAIIKYKKLRATNYAYMNDREEYYWMTELTDKYITEIQESEKNRHSLMFADIMKELAARQNFTFPFTVSFSEDGDLLSQWRAYAQDATGVSLGYTRKPILEEIPIEEAFTSMIIGEQYVPRSFSRYYVYRVHYFPKEGENDFIKKYILKSYEHFKQKYPVAEEIVPNGEYQTQIQMYAHSLWVGAIATKHKGFKEEKEIRIGWLEPVNLGTGEYDQEFKTNWLKHRTSAMGITPYIELDVESLLDLKEITVGPKYKGSMYDIKDFISMNGYNPAEIEIKKSTIPYR